MSNSSTFLPRLGLNNVVFLSAFDWYGHPSEGEVIPVPDSLTSEINRILPEGSSSILSARPDFIKDAPISFLSDSDDVRMSFIHEGAGYKNLVGYAVYPTDSPPATLADCDARIIFPNASQPFSGGKLSPGHTIRLPYSFPATHTFEAANGQEVQVADLDSADYTFPAGTSILLFMLPDGWRSFNSAFAGIGNTVANLRAYTTGEKNQTCVIASAVVSDSLVIGFEDIIRPAGDEDFNDTICTISFSPSLSVIDTSNINRAPDIARTHGTFVFEDRPSLAAEGIGDYNDVCVHYYQTKTVTPDAMCTSILTTCVVPIKHADDSHRLTFHNEQFPYLPGGYTVLRETRFGSGARVTDVPSTYHGGTHIELVANTSQLTQGHPAGSDQYPVVRVRIVLAEPVPEAAIPNVPDIWLHNLTTNQTYQAGVVYGEGAAAKMHGLHLPNNSTFRPTKESVSLALSYPDVADFVQTAGIVNPTWHNTVIDSTLVYDAPQAKWDFGSHPYFNADTDFIPRPPLTSGESYTMVDPGEPTFSSHFGLRVSGVGGAADGFYRREVDGDYGLQYVLVPGRAFTIHWDDKALVWTHSSAGPVAEAGDSPYEALPCRSSSGLTLVHEFADTTAVGVSAVQFVPDGDVATTYAGIYYPTSGYMCTDHMLVWAPGQVGYINNITSTGVFWHSHKHRWMLLVLNNPEHLVHNKPDQVTVDKAISYAVVHNGDFGRSRKRIALRSIPTVGAFQLAP